MGLPFAIHHLSHHCTCCITAERFYFLKMVDPVGDAESWWVVVPVYLGSRRSCRLWCFLVSNNTLKGHTFRSVQDIIRHLLGLDDQKILACCPISVLYILGEKFWKDDLPRYRMECQFCRRPYTAVTGREDGEHLIPEGLAWS